MLYANVCLLLLKPYSTQSMKTRHVSKVIGVFSKNLFMSIRHVKKEMSRSHYTAIHWAIYLHKPVYIFSHRAALFLNMQNVHIVCVYIIYYYYVCVSLCAHILYFDEVKFSIKLFSFLFYSFCCQTTVWILNSDWNATHWDITISPFQDCTKILII